MIKTKIAIDVDGVILDSIKIFCKSFNEKYNTNYNENDATKWNFFLDWNISKESAYEVFYDLFKNTSNVPLIDKEIPKIMNILNKQYNVDILTARTPEYNDQLIKNLDLHNIKEKIEYNKIIYAIDIQPQTNKLEENYDIYIDDNPNLVKPMKNEENKFLLLYDQNWNKSIECNGNVFRVRNWKEILNTVKIIELIMVNKR